MNSDLFRSRDAEEEEVGRVGGGSIAVRAAKSGRKINKTGIHILPWQSALVSPGGAEHRTGQVEETSISPNSTSSPSFLHSFGYTQPSNFSIRSFLVDPEHTACSPAEGFNLLALLRRNCCCYFYIHILTSGYLKVVVVVVGWSSKSWSRVEETK